jgi:hypothetical protein
MIREVLSLTRMMREELESRPVAAAARRGGPAIYAPLEIARLIALAPQRVLGGAVLLSFMRSIATVIVFAVLAPGAMELEVVRACPRSGRREPGRAC